MEPGRELFERYLQAVKKYLPWNRQDDILAELRANLEAQIEEREEELGRPLTEGEMVDWLKQLGSPMQVAGRYQPQQYLIGPTFFPMYWYVLRMGLVWGSAVYAVVNIVLVVTQAVNSSIDVSSVAQAIARFPGVLMTIAAWVTLAFAVLEFISSHYPHLCPHIPGIPAVWSPSSLPPLEKESSEEKRPRNFAHIAAEVIFGYLFLIWLLLVPHYPFLLMGPGLYALQNSPFKPASIWTEFYWVVLALTTIQLAWNCVLLWRGSWQRPRTVFNFVSKIFGLTGMAVLLTAPDHAYLALRNPLADQAQYGAKLAEINSGIWHVDQLICAILAIQLVWEIIKMGFESVRGGVTAHR